MRRVHFGFLLCKMQTSWPVLLGCFECEGHMTSCPSVTRPLRGLLCCGLETPGRESREARPVLSSGLSVRLMFVCPSVRQTDVWSAPGDAERPQEPTAHRTGVSPAESSGCGRRAGGLADGGAGGGVWVRTERLEAQLLGPSERRCGFHSRIAGSIQSCAQAAGGGCPSTAFSEVAGRRGQTVGMPWSWLSFLPQ